MASSANLSAPAGNESGYMRHGENFLRSRRRKSGNVMTPKRLAQQQKIKVCNEFTKPFAGHAFFNKTFPAYGSKGSGYNRATSAILNQAIIGSYPDIAIAYPLVLISQGPLPAPVDALANPDAEGNILFTWTDNTGTGTAKADDKVVLVGLLYHVKTNYLFIECRNKSRRTGNTGHTSYARSCCRNLDGLCKRR